MLFLPIREWARRFLSARRAGVVASRGDILQSLGDQAATPSRVPLGWPLIEHSQDPALGRLVVPALAAATRLVQKPLHAQPYEAASPLADGRRPQSFPPINGNRSFSIGRGQDSERAAAANRPAGPCSSFLPRGSASQTYGRLLRPSSGPQVWIDAVQRGPESPED